MKLFVVISEPKWFNGYPWNTNGNKEIEHYSSRDYSLVNAECNKLANEDTSRQFWIVTREE